MSLSKVIFIRHGQTDFNKEHRLQGALPVPLNDCGRLQSKLLAEHLRTVTIDALYSSPRQRARETAQIIAKILGKKVHEDERLGEIVFGDFESHTFAEVKSLYPSAYRKWESGYRAYRVPGGESRIDVQLRMQAIWNEITSLRDLETVAIVGHSSALMILLASMFARLPEISMSNTSLTTLERFQDVWEITGFGETPHLTAG